MLSSLPLLRPLIFFDTETTGTDIAKDRIIELSTTKFFPDGAVEVKTHRFNPTIPIPLAASRVHGIYDTDVEDEPTFAHFAQAISDYFSDSDIGGYNVARFDLPLLVEELLRAKVKLPFDEDTKIIDAMKIYHMMEKRDLSAAVKFYCDKDHDGAHGAEADALASAEVLDAQIEKYDLDPSVESLHDLCNQGSITIDYAGKFTRNDNGEIIFAFGKHKGKLATSDPGYLEWMLQQDFPFHTKYCIKKILSGELK